MDREKRVYDDILQMLPNPEEPSPMVRLNATNPLPGFTLYAKLEWLNPFGSVKDRAASFLIRKLEQEGKLTPPAESGGERKSVVEPTSGNTGLSLAALASVLGYGMRAVVPNKVPLEKKALLKLAGAELDVITDNLCPAPGLGEGSIGIAKTHAKAQPHKYAMPNQYENEANVRAHFETTGPEIWRQTDGKITHFFASLGTAGTITGNAKYLKGRNPDIKIVVVVPDEGHDVPGLRTPSELPNTNLFQRDLVDEIVVVEGELAFQKAAELFRREGLRAGPSSGLIVEGARRVLERDRPEGGVGVAIFCDDAFKYMSSFIRHMPELAEGTDP